MKETNIFELLNEPYHLPKKVKLFEAFSGIGCQRMAFEKAGIDYEMVGISEIDKYALQSYMSIHGETKNFGSITDIKGKDLPHIDVFTWSFPCTDLSKAGKQAGMSVGTRSGLVYEVLRILHEAKEHDTLPKVLIMENVVDLVQSKFIRQFQEIQLELEEFGYSNYVETLNAKNYGVAQNRDRIFMVSILGDHYYEFPKQQRLEKKLKDYLETDVDEKYYLTESLLRYMNSTSSTGKYDRQAVFTRNFSENKAVASAITTLAGNRPTDNFIKEPVCLNSKVDGKQPSVQDRVYDSDGISTCVTTAYMPFVTVPEATEKGYAEAVDGDSINFAQPNSKTRRGRVGKQVSQTLTTQSQIAVVEQMRIRKLTPLECWRLMGIDDEDFYKAEKVVSNSQLYKQAGNGIVVDVFAEIVKKLL